MDDFKTWVNDNIRSNDPANVSAEKLRTALLELRGIIDWTSLNNSNALYLGNITEKSTFPTGSQSWGFAAPGTYSNAGDITINENSLGLITSDGSGNFSKIEISMPKDTPGGYLSYETGINNAAVNYASGTLEIETSTKKVTATNVNFIATGLNIKKIDNQTSNFSNIDLSSSTPLVFYINDSNVLEIKTVDSYNKSFDKEYKVLLIARFAENDLVDILNSNMENLIINGASFSKNAEIENRNDFIYLSANKDLILFDPSTLTLTVPEGISFRSYKPSRNVIRLKSGVYNLNDSSPGLYRVYLKYDGTIYKILFSESQLMALQRDIYLGWVFVGDNQLLQNYDFPKLLGNVIDDGTNLKTPQSKWLANVRQTNSFKFPSAILNFIKDIWFEFPNGKPSWWENREPELRSIAGSSYSPYQLRIHFRGKNNNNYLDDKFTFSTADAKWNGYAQHLIYDVVAMGGNNEPTFRIHLAIDTQELFGNSKLILSSDYANVMRPKILKKSGPDKGVLGFLERANGLSRTKTLLCSYPMIFDTHDFSITVAPNTRFITENGTIIRIKEGKNNLNSLKGGLIYIYLKADGTFTTSKFSSNQQLNSCNLYYIGYFHTDRNSPSWFDFGSLNKHIITNTDNEYHTQGQIYVPPIRRRDISEGVKMLFFGSSWFQNTWFYINKITANAGIDAKITGFFTAGAYFSQWNKRYDTNESVQCWTSEKGADWTLTDKKFKDALAEGGWDLICSQQGAFQSIDWVSHYQNEYSDFLSKIKRHFDIDTIFGFNSTWTPATAGNLAPFSNDTEGKKAWQTLNWKNVQRFMQVSGIKNIIPNGSLVWILRNSSLNDGKDLAADGLHLNNGLPMFAVNLNLFHTYLSPMFGVKIEDINWLPDVNTQRTPQFNTDGWTEISAKHKNTIIDMIKLSHANRFNFVK